MQLVPNASFDYSCCECCLNIGSTDKLLYRPFTGQQTPGVRPLQCWGTALVWVKINIDFQTMNTGNVRQGLILNKHQKLLCLLMTQNRGNTAHVI